MKEIDLTNISIKWTPSSGHIHGASVLDDENGTMEKVIELIKDLDELRCQAFRIIENHKIFIKIRYLAGGINCTKKCPKWLYVIQDKAAYPIQTINELRQKNEIQTSTW